MSIDMGRSPSLCLKAWTDAPTWDCVISTNELDLYVSNRVKQLTKDEQQLATAKPDTTPDLRTFVVP